MSFTHVVTRQYRDSSGANITSTETVIDDTELNFDGQVAISATNHEIDWAAVVANLKSLSISADQICTVNVNSGVTVGPFTDLATSNGTSANPIVSSASHNFVTADVGAVITVTSGTSWTPGTYTILLVDSNDATLSAPVGSSASLTAGSWSEAPPVVLSLIQGQNLIWTHATDGPSKNPFGSLDVVKLFVTNPSGTVLVNFKVRALAHYGN